MHSQPTTPAAPASTTAVAVGAQVLWLHTEPRGWNESWWVPATVVKVSAKRLTLDAELRTGGVKRVVVTPERVKLRELYT